MSRGRYYGDVRCPSCQRRNSKVTCSRGIKDGRVKRWRECLQCQTKFYSFEEAPQMSTVYGGIQKSVH